MRGGSGYDEVWTVRGGGKREREGNTIVVPRFEECGVRENGVRGGIFHRLKGYGRSSWSGWGVTCLVALGWKKSVADLWQRTKL